MSNFLVRSLSEPLPMQPPTAGWVFDWLFMIIWVATLFYVALQFYKTRRFTDFGLIFLSASSGFWIEWYADWAVYLLYNPRLMLMPWESQFFMTPYKPWAVIWGYGVFFMLGIPFTQWVINAVLEKKPHWSRAVVLPIVSMTAFYMFDVIAEVIMTAMGWYTYTRPLPPAFHFEKGSFSLVHPGILFALWAWSWFWLFDRPDRSRENRMEKWAGVVVHGNAAAEFKRLAVWCIGFCVVLFLNQVLLSGIIRVLFLEPYFGPSELVPF